MSILEMKKDIQEKIEVLNEAQLKEVEIFIERINTLNVREWNLEKYVNEIIEERSEILEKLAQ